MFSIICRISFVIRHFSGLLKMVDKILHMKEIIYTNAAIGKSKFNLHIL